MAEYIAPLVFLATLDRGQRAEAARDRLVENFRPIDYEHQWPIRGQAALEHVFDQPLYDGCLLGAAFANPENLL